MSRMIFNRNWFGIFVTRAFGSIRRPLLVGSLLALAACGVPCSLAYASPIFPGIDSYSTLNFSYQGFGATPIPADFFDPGSDPFMDTIGYQGVPLGPGATTDTQIERLDTAKFKGPGSTSAPIRIQIVALSMASVFPITVTYDGGTREEQWDVQVGLSATPQPLGSMTITEINNKGGSFDLILPVLPRLTFTRASDGAVRVLDYGALGLPSLEFHASAVPWTHTTTPDIIHVKGFCPACDSPDGVPVEMAENANNTQFFLVPATAIP